MNSEGKKKKWLFIRNPKTASSAIARMPFVVPLGHLLSERKLKYTFGVIRDPLDRFVSAYKHHRFIEDSMYYEEDKHSKLRFLYPEINQFVKAIHDKEPEAIEEIQSFVHWIPQWKFLEPCSEILIYEDLENELKRIGLFSKPQRINVSTEDPSIQLNDFSKEFLSILYKQDFKLYEKILKNKKETK